MAIHVATKTLMPIINGAPYNNNTITIMQKAQSTTEERMMVDTTIPNTVGNPTIKAYLEAEDADGYVLTHMDQTYVITVSA